MASDEFDSARGTDTHGTVRLAELEIDSPNAEFGQSYQTTPPQMVEDAIRFIGVDPEEFSFIDLGCGKGRMLLVAAELGFDPVVGIDFAPELIAVARDNIARVGARNIHVEVADAADYDFPVGDIVVFLYNPFLHEVMTPVMQRLGEQHSGRLYVIYRYPKCRDVVDAADFLEYVGEVPGWEGERGVHVWRSTRQTT